MIMINMCKERWLSILSILCPREHCLNAIGASPVGKDVNIESSACFSSGTEL